MIVNPCLVETVDRFNYNKSKNLYMVETID